MAASLGVGLSCLVALPAAATPTEATTLTSLDTFITPRILGDAPRLEVDLAASPQLQDFVATWDRFGVPIAESKDGGNTQLVAFSDVNGNGMPDDDEPVLAQVEGTFSQIPQLAYSQSASGEISGRCYVMSYVLRPGEFEYRGKKFVVTLKGISYESDNDRSCDINFTLSSPAFPGESWLGLTKGTKWNEPYLGGWFIEPSTTTAYLELPKPTPAELLGDAYGHEGELAIASVVQGTMSGYPEERINIGTWKSEVTINE